MGEGRLAAVFGPVKGCVWEGRCSFGPDAEGICHHRASYHTSVCCRLKLPSPLIPTRVRRLKPTLVLGA